MTDAELRALTCPERCIELLDEKQELLRGMDHYLAGNARLERENRELLEWNHELVHWLDIVHHHLDAVREGHSEDQKRWLGRIAELESELLAAAEWKNAVREKPR